MSARRCEGWWTGAGRKRGWVGGLARGDEEQPGRMEMEVMAAWGRLGADWRAPDGGDWSARGWRVDGGRRGRMEARGEECKCMGERG